MTNVIIPLYKGRETLPAALDSLIAQTKKLFFVTIVNDCDGEDYSDIIEEYEKRGLTICYITTPQNGGAGVARQYAMDKDQHSKYFMFLDADDLLLPRAVEALTREADKNDADVIIGNFITGYGPGQSEGVWDSKRSRLTWCHGKIYRAKYLKDNDIRFLPWLRLNEDAYFNGVACKASKKVYMLDEPFYVWNCNPNSVTRKNGYLEYMHRTYNDFIISQVLALLKRADILGDDFSQDDALVTLTGLYQTCALAYEMGWDDYSYLSALELLQDFTPLQSALATRAGWEFLFGKITLGAIEKEKILMFHLNFMDWVNNYIRNPYLYKWDTTILGETQ